MVTDRPHLSNSNSSASTSELFICLTSRLSSSSMKISSKSILSPGRAREASQLSLSNSLSRRLRTSGSMKGGQASPMFPSNGKKRGCAFDNPEPSSPKVTCIGQVRVKTKKQGRKIRTRSKRRGEISFRRAENNNHAESNQASYSHAHANHQFLNPQQQPQQQQESLPHRNQKWVHLPLTICEALRTFGADLNCFLPCRSSCMANEKEKEDKAAGSENGSSCGAVFARWLVAVQDGDGEGKGVGERRDIEFVIGEEEDEREQSGDERRSYRRHILEEMELKEEMEEGARVSICIPPKNALLLMRCRSDPVRMAALANKFWEPPLPQNDADEEDEDEDEDEDGLDVEQVRVSSAQEAGSLELEGQKKVEYREELMCETIKEHQTQETDTSLVTLEGEREEESRQRSSGIDDKQDENLLKQEIGVINQPVLTQEKLFSDGNFHGDNHENAENMLQQNECGHQDEPKAEEHEVEGAFTDDSEKSSVLVKDLDQEQDEDHDQDEVQDQDQPPEFKAVGQNLQKEQEPGVRAEYREEKEINDKSCRQQERAAAEETTTRGRSVSKDLITQEGQIGLKLKESTESQPLLPDCLLLMMCEPKLSMEVSKETWVCSTDFIRSLPPHSKSVNKIDAADEPKKRINIDTNPATEHNNSQQPPRYSCSYPARPPPRAAGTESMCNMIERKLVVGKAYEPLVLKRCKSEPMRSAAKPAPDACFWKNRKLEPHSGATLGVGAAGVGF